MKFSTITINNFRQYLGKMEIDLETRDQQNIVIIGGKNGYGKTNFLLSIVWCLYGEKISQIDENFKKEIQKERNYSNFMQQSINWTAKANGENSFSVSVTINDIEVPELENQEVVENTITIIRSFNITTLSEEISIINPLTGKELFNEENDKINFINDYIIPIDAAKFIFFDAEKIAEIANLSIKDEGSFINDALGKILGLDIYETLIDDLETYITNLKKEGANKNLQEEIADKEKAIKIYTSDIITKEEENAQKQKDIDKLIKDIREYDEFILNNSKQGAEQIDRTVILDEISSLKIKEIELTDKFNDLSEAIPLTILTGKIEEVCDHISKQEKNNIIQNTITDNKERIDEFIEKLFNKPPEPENSSMTFRDKTFYYQKAQDLSSNLFKLDGEMIELPFEHDITNADKKLLTDTLNYVRIQSKDIFESSINEINALTNKLDELNLKLKRAEADLEDETIVEYLGKKDRAQFNITDLNRSIGQNIEIIKKAKDDSTRISHQLKNLVERVEINERNKIKILKCINYQEALNSFLTEQKNLHKSRLEKTILEELKKLLHKLSTDHNLFIEDVKVHLLANGQGMKITLYDQNDKEIRKESLSSGEKQIYISCLIKAILNESIQNLPIFIDTPLGRLDEEHRDNITLNYYPNLSSQVILFSTNSEITPKRFNEISGYTSKSYLLVNDGANTTIKSGYYK